VKPTTLALVLLWPFLGQLVAVLRGRPVGRCAPRQFQAGEPTAALLPIVAPIVSEILTLVFLNGETQSICARIASMVPAFTQAPHIPRGRDRSFRQRQIF